MPAPLHAEVRGDGDAVVLLHGLGGDGSNWAPQVGRLVPRWRTVAVDLRGFGDSPRTPRAGDVTLEGHARDVVDVLDRLGLDRVVLVGLSMGGMVAQVLALDAPDRLAGLFLADTTSDLSAHARQQNDRLRTLARQSGMDGVAEVLLAGCFTPASLEEDAPFVRAYAASLTATDPDAFVAGLDAIDGLDVHGRLGELDLPVAVVCGEHDAFLADCERLAGAVRGATLHVIPGAGHVANLERADAFTAALERFLTERAARGPRPVGTGG